MRLPKTYKGILKLLIQIAENDNDYQGNLTRNEELQIGALIADIQNDLGEMNDDLLDKLGLFYDGSK